MTEPPLIRVTHSAFRGVTKVEIGDFVVPELVSCDILLGPPDGMPQVRLTINAENLVLIKEVK